jgi:large subunit ribosomal protein L15
MKLHDLRPAAGSRTERTRVGRGIAAGKGKTAGRGTKGQKARAGGSIPPWFEGGQTPIHMRVPKLRGFKNRSRIEYEVVNVGRIAEFAERGRFAGHHDTAAPTRKGKAAPITVNAAMLREAGLIGSARTPLKVLGAGEVGLSLFVVADAFTRSAREKLEGAGGTAQLIEVPAQPGEALKGRPAEARKDEPAEPAAAAGTAPAPEAAAPDAGEVSGPDVTAAAAEAAELATEPESAAAEIVPAPEPEQEAPAETPKPRRRRSSPPEEAG